MTYIYRLKKLLGLSKTPIRTGHTYTDKITGETFDVDSVGRRVSISRNDAKQRPDNRVLTEDMRKYIDDGVVVHDESVCNSCRSDKYV